MVSFYYISKDTKRVPERPSDVNEWNQFFNDNSIICSTQKHPFEPLERIQVVIPIPLDLEGGIDDECELHEAACQAAGPFCYDKQICKFFNT